jgi:hypothetical protein
VVRVAASDEEPSQCFGDKHRPRFGPVTVEVTQSGSDIATAIDGPSELESGPLRLSRRVVDPSTVPVRNLNADTLSSAQSQSPRRAQVGCRRRQPLQALP